MKVRCSEDWEESSCAVFVTGGIVGSGRSRGFDESGTLRLILRHLKLERGSVQQAQVREILVVTVEVREKLEN